MIDMIILLLFYQRARNDKSNGVMWVKGQMQLNVGSKSSSSSGCINAEGADRKMICGMSSFGSVCDWFQSLLLWCHCIVMFLMLIVIMCGGRLGIEHCWTKFSFLCFPCKHSRVA